MEIKIKWGILGSATIAVENVIPAMLNSQYCEVFGIASRSQDKAKKVANQFQIPNHYSGYQELLDDEKIEAVYIPLPNHLHVDWAIKALQAGKHVLVEKPVALSSSEAIKLMNAAKRYPKLNIQEAFMYKHHPQWVKVKELIDEGEIGKLKTIQSSFSFFDDDPKSIVNKKEFGGGSLMDIGCYPVSISRYLFGSEPNAVLSSMVFHPEFKVDVLTTGILEFENGRSTFFSSTQVTENQYVKIFGTEGSITFEIPFNPSPDKSTKIELQKEGLQKQIEFEICDQYTLQADDFSLAILEKRKVEVGLEDAVNNMIIIEKMFESNKLGKRINL